VVEGELLLNADEVSVAVILKLRRAFCMKHCRYASAKRPGNSEGLLEAPELHVAGQTPRKYLCRPLSHPTHRIFGALSTGADQQPQNRPIETRMTSRRLARSTKPSAFATISRRGC
jgi:hypothetical protein